jgi:hypothetical protein
VADDEAQRSLVALARVSVAVFSEPVRHQRVKRGATPPERDDDARIVELVT